MLTFSLKITLIRPAALLSSVDKAIYYFHRPTAAHLPLIVGEIHEGGPDVHAVFKLWKTHLFDLNPKVSLKVLHHLKKKTFNWFVTGKNRKCYFLCVPQTFR